MGSPPKHLLRGEQDSVLPSRLVGTNCPENGVVGNYDPLQSELADKQTLQAVYWSTAG